MSNKNLYREFCKKELDIPIFSKDWWLDAVCVDGEWDVALVKKGDNIVASMPYFIKKDGFFNLSIMPPLTQTLGPYIKYPKGQKHYKRLSYEKEVMSELIEQLPKTDIFNQSFHHKITNWLPFYWNGFNSSVRYTYIIKDLKLKSEDDILKDFTNYKRRDIKKASKLVEVRFDLPVEDFYNHHKMSLKKMGDVIDYDFNIFKRVYENAYKYSSCSNLYSIDSEGNIHSALFIVWDKNSTYALISSLDPDFRNSGSLSLLFFEAIKIAKRNSEVFDFEGSMIEYAEQSYRQFGGIQTPYFQIYKSNSKLWKIKSAVDRIIKR